MTTQTCQCACLCDEPATTDDDGGNRVCDACADYTTDADGETHCSREHDGDTCPRCKSAIRWGRIATHSPGEPNDQDGTCGCGTWYRADRGGWTVPDYRTK
jgi:hypothetical protein